MLADGVVSLLTVQLVLDQPKQRFGESKVQPEARRLREVGSAETGTLEQLPTVKLASSMAISPK